VERAGRCRPMRERCGCPKSAKAKASLRRIFDATATIDRITNIDDPNAGPKPRRRFIFIASPHSPGREARGGGRRGPVLDHTTPPAIENHLHYVGDRLMQAFGAHPPYAVFSDSLEV